jgi:hypothetical protein
MEQTTVIVQSYFRDDARVTAILNHPSPEGEGLCGTHAYAHRRPSITVTRA